MVDECRQSLMNNYHQVSKGYKKKYNKKATKIKNRLADNQLTYRYYWRPLADALRTFSGEQSG